MRGRTNVAGNGIAINASTQEKLISTGRILRGDFVEYYSTPSWIDLAGGADFKFTIGDYVIAAFGSLLSAFKNGQRIAVYSDYGCGTINKYNDWIVFYDAGTVGVLSIDNDEFTLIDALEIDSSSASGCCIAAGGGKICVTRVTNIVVLDIDADGNLSNPVITSVSLSSYEDFLNYADGFYYTYTDSRPSGGYTYQNVTPRTVEITIDSSNQASKGNVIICYGAKIYNNAIGGVNGRVRQIYQKGKIIGITSCYYRYEYRYSSEEYHGQQGYIYFINIATGAVTEFKIADHGEAISCISNGKLLTSKCYKHQQGTSVGQWVYIANAIRLYAFDEETYSLTELSVKTYSEDTENAVQGNRAGCEENRVYVQLRQSGTTHPGGIRIYEITGGTMCDISDKNRVEPYVNGNNPIGVAKESGAAGDTIPVYIPTPSA